MATRTGRIHGFVMALVTLALFACCAAPSVAQTAHSSTPASISSLWPTWSKARPDDVQSVQSIINAYFDVLSGSATTERDWDRFKSLSLPDGRFVSLKTWNNDPHLIPDIASVQQMVERLRINLRKADSEERPIDIQVTTSRSLVHAFVTSETHVHVSNGVRSARFVESFELVKDADRYWIVEISSEMIPDSYRSQ
jgi:hypothetical protein